ncbi:MAG: tetratricopeptide repeat protein, partial [Candidatus Cloacimonetes bacterium]|nr:tetratricopeptide repeat protein [Candidatus Cloacimonadota bacterium]
MGVFYLLSEKYNISLSRFKKALKLAVNDFQKIFVLLKMGEIFSSQHNFVKLDECLEELEKFDLKDNFKISFIGLKALNIGLTGKIDEAISLIEDYIPTIKTRNDDNYFIKLGALHNNLAFLYHRKKFLDEADKNFQITKNVWEKSNYIRKLGVVYNNIGDVALIQGDTKTALEYFDKAIKICKKTDSKKIMVLSLLNFGETYIKLGKFLLAENYLNQALEASLSFENRPFYDSIINNLAISRSKVNNFSYYLNFIKENFPEIIKGHIEKINPLTKTYFYFLYNLGNYDTIEKLLKKHKNMFMESKEQESFNQIYGFLYLKRGEYSKAMNKIEQAFKYSEQNKSVYAQAINYIRLAECHLGIGDTVKAIDICKKAESICLNNDFNYWLRVVELRKIKAQLIDGSINLRILIRRLFVILKYVQKNDLYFLEIEIYELLVQIYASLNAIGKAKLFFNTYKNALNRAVTGLNEKDKEIYLRKSHYYLKDYTKLETVKIFSQKPEV